MMISVFCLGLGLCYGFCWTQTLEAKLQAYEAQPKTSLPDWFTLKFVEQPYRKGLLEQPGGKRLNHDYAYFTRGKVKSSPAVYPKVSNQGANSEGGAR